MRRTHAGSLQQEHIDVPIAAPPAAVAAPREATLLSSSSLARESKRTVLAYLLGAAAWIALSEVVVGWLIRDPDVLVRISVYKGGAFVAVTAGLLHLLLRHRDRTIRRTVLALEQAEEERIRHEVERRRAHAIVESTGEAIVVTGPDATITSFSAGATRLLGYAPEEVLGRATTVFAPPEQVDQELEWQQRARAGAQFEVETTRLRKDGSRVAVSIRYAPMHLPEELAEPEGAAASGVSLVLRDLSDHRSANAIAESERRFAQNLIEAMPGIFYLFDEEGRFLRWNRNFERASGYRSDEIARMHPREFFALSDRKLVLQRVADVFKHGTASVEALFAARDGNETPYFFTGKRLMYQGRPCLVGLGVDMSERRRAELALIKSEERYRTTLESTLEGCQLLDFEWRYLFLNEAASKHNRRANGELLGQRMPDVWPGIEATAAFAMLQRCMDERVPLHEEIEFTFPDGTSGWFDLRAQPVPEGIFLLSIDISERKRAEQELRELNDNLERKVLARTRELEEARAHAEGTDKLKSAFLATMSHELRTPLNAILGFTGILLQQLPGPLNAEQAEQLAIIQSSASHLLELINDVLDISRVEAGQLGLRLNEFELAPVLARAAESVRPLAEKKGLTIALALPASKLALHSDARRVEQVVLNLLQNAIKFTDAGTVKLSAELVERENESGGRANATVAIRVEDTGIGIHERDLPHLFQPFRQLDAGPERPSEGTGLGLAICKRLVEALGGSIEVESTWRSGSTFTVRLPRESGEMAHSDVAC